MSKAKTKEKNENKTEKALAAEKEQFGKQQVRISLVFPFSTTLVFLSYNAVLTVFFSFYFVLA